MRKEPPKDKAVRWGDSAVGGFPDLRRLSSAPPTCSNCRADKRRWEMNKITEKVIGCAFTVGNVMGCGFVEKVYENALVYELRKTGLLVEQQYGIEVKYDGIVVGQFFADLLVEERVLVELKAVKTLDEHHFAQCLNYLKATGFTICLLINFANPKVEIKRIARNF